MMELKKVEKQEAKNYAKKKEVTEKEMKQAVPKKWVAASALGMATLMYTASSVGERKLGVVFGCLPDMLILNHTPLWHALDNIHTFFIMLLILPF